MKRAPLESENIIRSCWPESAKGLWMEPECRAHWATVIVTTYQRENYVVRTAASVYRQSYRPIELIIIDDGSKDCTKKNLLEWWNNIPKSENFEFTYVYQDNAGAPNARNHALSLSSGEFIQEVGSDDLLHPCKLELHIQALIENKDCQSAWSPLRRFEDSEEKMLFDSDVSSDVQFKNLELKSITSNIFVPQFLPSAGLHRRSVFFNAGPWLERLKRWQDLEYQSRMAYCVEKYVQIDVPLYFFRQHGGERINTQYNQLKGVKAGFESLLAIEKNLNIMYNVDPQVKLEMCKFYVSLATLAAKYSSHYDLCTAVEGALRHRNNFIFRIRMKLFQLVSKLLGGKVAYFLSQLYVYANRA